jgi:uncharacterized protein YuzE
LKTLYDPEADALYLRFLDKPVAESEEVADGVVLDFDDTHRIVGIEVLEASKRLSTSIPLKQSPS